MVGVTGGIASGKSLVAGFLRQMGEAVVDADQVAREVLSPGGSVLRSVRDRFGSQMVGEDGVLDRVALAAVIYADPAARRDLEGIMHPAIVAASRAHFERLAGEGHETVVYEAALLVETGRWVDLDWLVVVLAADSLRRQRLIDRLQIGAREAEQRMAAQWPQWRKALCADYVIDNSGTVEQTRKQVAQLWASLVERREGSVR